jgi:hypothetical protein
MRIPNVAVATGAVTLVAFFGCGVSQKELDDRVSSIHSRVDQLTDFEKLQLDRIRGSEGTTKRSSSERRRAWKTLQNVYGKEVKHRPLTEVEFQEIMSKFHGNVKSGPEYYPDISRGDAKTRARVGALAQALTRPDNVS